ARVQAVGEVVVEVQPARADGAQVEHAVARPQLPAPGTQDLHAEHRLRAQAVADAQRRDGDEVVGEEGEARRAKLAHHVRIDPLHGHAVRAVRVARSRHTCSISWRFAGLRELSKTMSCVSPRWRCAISMSQLSAQGCSKAMTSATSRPSNSRIFCMNSLWPRARRRT